MPRQAKNPLYIDWIKSQSKQILFEDLRYGRLPLDESVMPAEEAWERYRRHPTFIAEKVIFEQFAKRLKGHREQMALPVRRAEFDAVAVAHDRANHPFPTHNVRGQPNFHLSPAEELLRDNVCNKRHEGKNPSDFQQTRDEYKVFEKRKFKELIYQTIRHIKFEDYHAARRSELPEDYQPW